MALAFLSCSCRDPNSEAGPNRFICQGYLSSSIGDIFNHHLDVVIIVASTVLKEAFGLFLIRRERQNNSAFSNWWRKHRTIGRIFTLLSFVDIYSLEVLCSKIGGSESLNAPFSNNIKNWIFWIGFLALLKKDLTPYIDLLPLLALISATAVVVFNGIWRIYLSIMYCYRKMYPSDKATGDEEPPITINNENNS
ncbi:26456_t:CDS:2 [Dentiscutata erythropus]|uniref:26456_t:CDS:1 n=1 Tax=Dentiscutata erythropus TaxID=1348616 RepID=A0A9N8Z440_9GLOM|nr:26456_t:CDS:2 [Dentiscutata erythropus]